MQLIVFLVTLWSIALFHRWEHRQFLRSLKTLSQSAAGADILRQMDWRLIGNDDGKLALRRSFEISCTADALRYAVPIIFLSVILIWLQSWMIAGVYLVCLLVKWFVTVTALDMSARQPRYTVTLWGRILFGETL